MYLANRSLSQRARHLLIPARGHLRWVGGGGSDTAGRTSESRTPPRERDPRAQARQPRAQPRRPDTDPHASWAEASTARAFGRSQGQARRRQRLARERRGAFGSSSTCFASLSSHSLPAGGARTPVAPPAVIRVLGGRRSSLGSRRLATHALCRGLHCLSVCLSLSVSLINVYRTITQKS